MSGGSCFIVGALANRLATCIVQCDYNKNGRCSQMYCKYRGMVEVMYVFTCLNTEVSIVLS